jgi:periplasmic divalent cation tolerance protein
MEAAIVMTTVASEDDAERLASALVGDRLAACVQQIRMESRYRYEDEVHVDPEILLLVKTAGDRVEQVQEYLRAEHPYDVPEILVVEAGGSAAYLEWLVEGTR